MQNPEYLDTKCLFSIEGNIGCGKSTLLQMLRSKIPSARWIEEPVTEWQDVGGTNLLERYYKEGTRWGFTFQTYALFTRIQRMQEAIMRFPDKVKIAERSILADRHVFSLLMKEESFMDEAEYAVFEAIYNIMDNINQNHTNKLIYLRCEPELCYDRTIKRKRPEEKEIPLEYLIKIHKKHEEWFMKEKKTDVLVIDATEDFRNDQAKIQEIMVQVKNFMKQ